MNNNLATVNSIYELFSKGDIPAIIDYISDNVQWEQWASNSAQQAGVPWLQARKGKDGVFEYFRTVGKELSIKDFRILSVMGNESQVAVEIVFEADVPDTGGHFADEEIHLWTFDEEGKVIRLRHYADTAQHIAAAKKDN